MSDVSVDDPVWTPRQRTNHRVTIRRLLDHLKETGRIENFARAAGRSRDGFQGMLYNDSDVYKWIEAAAYSITVFPDPDIATEIEHIVALIEAAQQPDGYLNTYFTLSEPDKRWTNLHFMHELFCAGHLIQGAIAYARATGSSRLLEVAARFADHIDRTFGPGKRRGYPGHEEIEPALVELYRETGEKRYLELARYFLEARGRQPSPFAGELENLDEIAGSRVRGYPDFQEHVRALYLDEEGRYDGRYAQDHLPLREQREVVGHAVRATYLYCGMADVARETGDDALLHQLVELWQDMTDRKMYVTGGIGSSHANEGFTRAYDLPNREAYSETCASVGAIMWSFRMFLLTGHGRYFDHIERVLYNAFLAGVSRDGERFFYVNPLESDGSHHRQPWFECACCPPNAARLIASLGSYIYAVDDDSLYVNLYVGSAVRTTLGGRECVVRQAGGFPWDGSVRLTLEMTESRYGTLRLRRPWWAAGVSLRVDGRQENVRIDEGYVVLEREWSGTSTVELDFGMEARYVQSHPLVRENEGKLALARGPLVYCLEQADNELPVPGVMADPEAVITTVAAGVLFPNAVGLEHRVAVTPPGDWNGTLYREVGSVPVRERTIRAVPYFLWDNRDAGPMRVWLPRG